MKQPILTVKNISVRYNHELAIQNISFTLKPQDVLVILGPNGGGKTTLLRALLGLVPYSGTIDWRTQNIAYVPPQESVNRTDVPPLTVAEFFDLKKVPAPQMLEMIKAVGLPTSIVLQEFNTLSTGQFQRMLLAWALVSQPSVLVLDEPTAGIDIGGEQTIYSLLHTFWKEWKLTIILVTHNVQMVWEHATDILCLNKRLMCFGPPDALLTKETLEKVFGSGVRLYEHRHPSK